ncbi:MAG: antibiotic biosynthesis monooxygenase [Nitrospira sp.]|nr:antibiotic biosynthesis monooxygenase [Nitrospira sp.]
MPIDTSLRVIARATAKPDHVIQVREILSALVEPTRREHGCLSYQLLENEADPTDFAFVEQWASAEAEQAHFTTPHVLSALQRLAGLLASGPQIDRYRVMK